MARVLCHFEVFRSTRNHESATFVLPVDADRDRRRPELLDVHDARALLVALDPDSEQRVAVLIVEVDLAHPGFDHVALDLREFRHRRAVMRGAPEARFAALPRVVRAQVLLVLSHSLPNPLAPGCTCGTLA